MPTLNEYTQQRIDQLAAKHQLRSLQETARLGGVRVQRDGKEYISFSCNNYLGLSHHEEVKAAAKQAIEHYGVGAGASRLVTGNHPLYTELEAQLARMKKTESALVFGSGYLANLGTIPALVGKGDLIIADKLVHACLLDGAALSGAALKRFSHNDVKSAEQLLEKYRKNYRHCLMLTDTIFSMDGDKAPLAELGALADTYDAWLLSDDAHGLGIIQQQGAVCDNHIQMGTLSKAVGTYGGYVCGSKALIDYLVTAARSVVFSTGLPPMVAAAALTSLTLIESKEVACETPLNHAQFFAKELGLPQPESAIVPYILGEEQAALDAAEMLMDAGFLVSAIRPPTVPKGTARLRFTFSALHDRQDVVRLVREVLGSRSWKRGQESEPAMS